MVILINFKYKKNVNNRVNYKKSLRSSPINFFEKFTLKSIKNTFSDLIGIFIERRGGSNKPKNRRITLFQANRLIHIENLSENYPLLFLYTNIYLTIHNVYCNKKFYGVM